jgi:DNA-binding transcriptional LysR family regulator
VGVKANCVAPLKISKPSSGLLNLAPLLVAFHQRYPDINLELTAGGERSGIARMETDVAIRLTNDPPETLVGYKLGQLPINIFGSRAYLKQAGTRDLAEHDWLVWHDENSLLNMEPALKRDIPNARIVLRTNSYNELFEAVNAGMGISSLSPLRLPKTHQLQALSPELYQFDQGVWLLSHPDLRNRERIRVFKDFMIEHLGGALTKHWKT